MKKYFLSCIIITVLAACNNTPVTRESNTTGDGHATHHTPAATGTMDAVKTLKAKYASLKFASKRDTVCGMPVTAGVVDTLLLEGKIYGFCATGCKEEFAKILVTEGKRKP